MQHAANSPRVIILHGGPGAGHGYLLPFSSLWRDYGLPVVFNDRIGCGKSTRLPETAGNESIWQEHLFVTETDHLILHLGLAEGPGFHLLGQSWGGMLAASFAATQPRGLRRLVLASALASRDMSIKGMNMLSNQMPSKVKHGLDEAEQRRDFEDPAYVQAVGHSTGAYLCRADPLPQELMTAFKHLSEDTTVYGTM